MRHCTRLTLVWPEAVEATLQVDGAVATLLVGIPLAAIPLDSRGSLASWLGSTTVAADGREVKFRLLPSVAASLNRPHPRLAVIEFVRVDPRVSLSRIASLVAPAAGPAHLPPIPASRPPLVALDQEPPPCSPLRLVKSSPHSRRSQQPSRQRSSSQLKRGLTGSIYGFDHTPLCRLQSSGAPIGCGW